jgi:signal transduction histidine kinase
MPSIRRSLIAYFLLLLALALAGVGLVVDQFAAEAFRARQKAEAERITQEYDFRCQESRRQFDEELGLRAAALGQELRLKMFVQYMRDREQRRERPRELEPWEKTYRLSMATLPLAPVGGGNRWAELPSVVIATFPRIRGPIYQMLRRAHAIEQRLYMDEQLHQAFVEEAGNHPKYFQFQFPYSRHIIRGAGPDLPLISGEPRNLADPFVPRHMNVRAADGELVRVVAIKSSLSGGPFRGFGPPPSRLVGVQALIGGTVTQSSLPPFLFNRGMDPLPFVYVQCGRPVAELDALYAQHAKNRDDDLREITQATRASLVQLRTQLGLIGVCTFLAVAAGSWLLVRRGLLPFRHLSDAVSQVSEKDFRLPVERSSLSEELLPVHDRLTHTLGALRRAFEREKQAVGDISHELRTPIASLLATLDVALRKPRAAEQYKATLEECRAIGKQLSRLVERIMTLASLDAGRDRTTIEPVDAAGLATDCAALIRPLAAAHELTLATDLDPKAELITDADKLREVLMNLLHNAVEYSSPGGHIELKLERSRGAVSFSVRDTGIGMTPDVQAQIFERFFRADPSRHATGVHAGLGLSIVKEYVGRLGGEIAVESAPGAGSTFRVTLPLVAGPVEDADPGDSADYNPSDLARSGETAVPGLASTTPRR